MLNGIHLVDFGNHRDTRLTFGPMTALVGQNGSGKTTVMRAIQEIARIATYPTALPGDSAAYRRRGSSQEKLAASWFFCKHSNDFDHGLVAGAGRSQFRRMRINGESQAWLPEPDAKPSPEEKNGYHAKQILREHLGTSEPEEGKIAYWEGKFVWHCRYFKTTGATLQGPSYSEQNPPRLGNDGTNLAWTLAYLMTAEPDRFAHIISALKEVVPTVKRIRARPVSVTRIEQRTLTVENQTHGFDQRSTVMGQELIFDMKSGDGLPASAISEGTLLALAVLTFVYGDDEAEMIMIDDVDDGLHPKAQRDLIRQLRRIQETHPKLQILVSTHSPYVVDEFKAEDVWVFAPDKDGCAVTKRLSDHPDAKRALEVLTTGEFWSAEGEPWVLDDEEPTARVAEEPHA